MIERDKKYYNHKISELYAVIENKERIIRDLQKQIVSLTNEKFVYECRNNKAIECIKENMILDENSLIYVYEFDERKELLEILKGGNNE